MSGSANAGDGSPEASKEAGDIHTLSGAAFTVNTIARVGGARRKGHSGPTDTRRGVSTTLHFDAAVMDDGGPIALGAAGSGGINSN